jgi:GT2 family glycosyltransferase
VDLFKKRSFKMSEIRKETVCAVVVTYNRKDLLIECLDALCKQTRPVDAIYIVDNFSSDGTAQLLLEHGYIQELPPENLTDPFELESSFYNGGLLGAFDDSVQYREAKGEQKIKIHYLRMHENTGGAGGFHQGVKRGYEYGYNWLWLMDDDGVPDVGALKNLQVKSKEANFLNPLVLNIDSKKDLSFGLYSYEHQISIKTIDDVKRCSKNGLLHDTVNPFNGTFISRKLIQKIGFPLKEMFIWGDEVEYYLRAKESGMGVATVIDAIHYHPKCKVETVDILFGKYKLNYQSSDLKNYCDIRNRAFIQRKYDNKALLKQFLAYSYMFATNLNFKGYLK